jgi:hypothetical protein
MLDHQLVCIFFTASMARKPEFVEFVFDEPVYVISLLVRFKTSLAILFVTHANTAT